MSVSVWPPLLLLLLLLLLWAVPTFQDKNTRVSAYKVRQHSSTLS
uniref:Leucine rich colipase-like 1 n=1 Tax=Mus musculus TaxID=10090 RepID=A0A087WQJ6_MOUSE